MNTTTEKKRFTTRDVMVIAAMMVLTFAVYGAVGTLTLPFPFLYLYCSAGIQEFFCATFYLVVANRLNKHGILMVWSTVFGIILGMIIGNTVPIWAAWESYVAKASTEGFSQEVFDMQLNMLSSPWHMIGACAITVALALLGCLFGQRILRRHFQKAGIVK